MFDQTQCKVYDTFVPSMANVNLDNSDKTQQPNCKSSDRAHMVINYPSLNETMESSQLMRDGFFVHQVQVSGQREPQYDLPLSSGDL